MTLRHDSRLRHIGVGRAHAGERVVMLVADLDVRIINADSGELLRRLRLDPTRDYQPLVPARPVSDVSRHLSPMSRDITLVGRGGFEPP